MVTRGNRDVYVKLALLVKEESFFGFRLSFESLKMAEDVNTNSSYQQGAGDSLMSSGENQSLDSL